MACCHQPDPSPSTDHGNYHGKLEAPSQHTVTGMRMSGSTAGASAEDGVSAMVVE